MRLDLRTGIHTLCIRHHNSIERADIDNFYELNDRPESENFYQLDGSFDPDDKHGQLDCHYPPSEH